MLRRTSFVSPTSSSSSSSTSAHYLLPLLHLQSFFSSSAVTSAAVAAPLQRLPFTPEEIGFQQQQKQQQQQQQNPSAAFLSAFSTSPSSPSAFIPQGTLQNQCLYTAKLHRQLKGLAYQGAKQKWIPKECLDSETKTLVASRLITATAFDDRQGGGAGGANNNSSMMSATLSKQEKHRDLLAHTRRIALEHYNWTQYWRSLAFDNNSNDNNNNNNNNEKKKNIVVDPSLSFAKKLKERGEGSDSFFTNFQRKKQEQKIGKREQQDDNNNNNNEILVSQIIETMGEFANQGGSTSQGGSWTWLVWNPFTNTDFSSLNRYGVSSVTKDSSSSSSASKKEEGATAEGKKEEEQDKATETSSSEKETASTEKKESSNNVNDEEKSVANKEDKKKKKKEELKEEKKKSKNRFSVSIGGRLEVINTPFDASPLEYGLFPILCINMTERAFLASPSEWATVPCPSSSSSNSFSKTNSVPSWSRAARNPISILSREATLPRPGYQAFESIEKQRERFVSGVLSHLNWQHATNQLEAALRWNDSEERIQRLEDKAQAAFDAAEQRGRDALKRRVADGASSTTEKEEQEEEEAAKAAATTEKEEKEKEKEIEEEEEEEQKSKTESSSTSASEEPTQAEDGSLHFKLGNGVEEFRYPDGNKTVLKTNEGITEWHFANPAAGSPKLTRQFASSGSVEKTEHFLVDGTVVVIFADGTMRTTTPDGKETLVKIPPPP